jgi:hypothetical protein
MSTKNIFAVYADKLKFANLNSYEWAESHKYESHNYRIAEHRDIPKERYTDPNSIVLMAERTSVFLIWREKNRYYAVSVDDWALDDYKQFYYLRIVGLSVRDALSFMEL